MLRAMYRAVTHITQEITTRKISLYMFSTCSADSGKQMQKFTSTRDDYVAANITMQTYITDVKALTQTDLV